MADIFENRQDLTSLLNADENSTQSRALETLMSLFDDLEDLNANANDTRSIFRKVCALATPQLGEICFLDLLNPGGRLERIGVHHIHPNMQKLTQQLRQFVPPHGFQTDPVIEALETKRPALRTQINDSTLKEWALTLPHLSILTQIAPQSSISVPLVTQRGFNHGVLTFIRTQNSEPFRLVEIKLAQLIAKRTAIAIENRDLVSQLQQRTQEAAEASHAKSQFLAQMSHEMRTPLTAILGYAEAALDDDPTKAHEYLRRILKSGHRLHQIIGDVLDLTKLEEKRIDIRKASFSLKELLQEVVNCYELQAREKGLQFEFKMGKVLFDRVTTDQARLRQIMGHLLSNAIKFTDHGRITLMAEQSVKSHDDRAVYICFTIKDSGVGMTPDQQEQIFSPFCQGDKAMNRRFGGSGLGLALARQLAQTLGGDIEILESKTGVGTVVTGYVDSGVQVFCKTQETKPQAKSNNEIEDGLSGYKILVVEDSPDVRLIIHRLLNKLGAKVECANDGVEGVTKALSDNFNVVLMDIQMPRLDGHQAMIQLRDLDYDVPVIAVTAHALASEKERALEEGFAAYLTKPVSKKALFETIVECQSNTRVGQLT